MCGLEKLKLDTITNVCDYFVLTFKRLSVMPRYKPTNPSEDTISRTWLTIVCLLSAVNKITSSDYNILKRFIRRPPSESPMSRVNP